MPETLSPQETVRLAIVAGAAGLLGLAFLLVLFAIVLHGLKKKGQPPKYLRDWAERLLIAAGSLLVGFMAGSEPKSKEQLTKPVPAEMKRAGK